MAALHDLAEVDWVLNQMVDTALQFVLEHVPTIQQYATDIFLDLIFVPRVVAKQLLLALVLETGRFCVSKSYYVIYQGLLVNLVSSRARRMRQLTIDMQQHATNQDEYMMWAEQHDVLTGNQEWRMDPACALYERDRIATTIDHYLHLMRRGDVFELLFLLRGNLGRNQFGLQHKSLFGKAQAGTKVLVETYHNVVCAALEFVCDTPTETRMGQEDEEVPTEARLAFFNEVRHAYGRSSLLLSGGAALGFYHVGVVKALMENNLMPRVIGGSSAGSIVCAMLATRTDEECVHDFFHLQGTQAPGHSGTLQLEFFRPFLKDNKHQDGKATWQLMLFPNTLRQFGSALYDLVTGNRRPSDYVKKDTDYFRSVLKNNVGNFTFQEAFDRTGRICNIIVSPKNQSDPPRLLNYLTAPHVLVWSAAVASASVPGIFEADCLMVKDPDGTERYESSFMRPDGHKGIASSGTKFSDGSFEKDLPMQQLSEMFNVNHFIISQVNPQAVLFGSYNHRTSVWSNPVKGFIDSLLKFLKHQCRNWILNVVKLVGSGRFRPLYAQTRANIGMQVLTQEYEGRDQDISLIPWLHHRSLRSAFLHMIYNPTAQDFFEWMAAAERETWKHIPRIKCHVAEEITLDQCVQRLRNRLILESRRKRRGQAQTNDMIGNGLPSFFASPSLNKLGNSDQASRTTESNVSEEQMGGQIPMQEPEQPSSQLQEEISKGYLASLKDAQRTMSGRNILALDDSENFDLNFGWSGMGLRGNRSSASLERQVSHSSGLFIDDEENPQQPPQENFGAVHGTGHARKPRANSLSRGSNNSLNQLGVGSMANFYYRKTSNANLMNMDVGSGNDLTMLRNQRKHSSDSNFF